MHVLLRPASAAVFLPMMRNAMNVFSNTVVTLSFKLYDSSNHLIEETDEPIAYLHGGHSGIFPKVEEALKDKKVGDSVSVTLEPEDAFGDYDTDLMRIEPLDQLPPDVAVGGHLDDARLTWEDVVAPAPSIVDRSVHSRLRGREGVPGGVEDDGVDGASRDAVDPLPCEDLRPRLGMGERHRHRHGEEEYRNALSGCCGLHCRVGRGI